MSLRSTPRVSVPAGGKSSDDGRTRRIYNTRSGEKIIIIVLYFVETENNNTFFFFAVYFLLFFSQVFFVIIIIVYNFPSKGHLQRVNRFASFYVNIKYAAATHLTADSGSLLKLPTYIYMCSLNEGSNRVRWSTCRNAI